MKFYELNCLVKPDFENEVAQISQQIQDILAKFQSKAEYSINPARVRLAYPIEKYREAFLLSFSFYLESEQINTLKAEVSQLESILRLLVKETKPRQEGEAQEPILEKPKTEKPAPAVTEETTQPVAEAQVVAEEAKTETTPVETPAQPIEKPHKKKKAEIADIDKKLEEMLNQ